MFLQFFSKYLSEKEDINVDYLTPILKDLPGKHMKLGMIAVYKGYMTAADVDTICKVQEKSQHKFGEIAISNYFLTREQVDECLKEQEHKDIVYGDELNNALKLSHYAFNDALSQYKMNVQLYNDHAEDVFDNVIENYLEDTGIKMTDTVLCYIKSCVQMLEQMVGDDYVPLKPVRHSHYVTEELVADTKKTRESLSLRYNNRGSVEQSLLNSIDAVYKETILNADIKTDKPQSFTLPFRYSFGTIYIKCTV